MINWLKSLVPLVMLTAFTFAGAPPQLTALTPAPTFQIDQPEIPQIEAIYNLGVPAGNAATPRHLALDRPGGLLYIFSQGIPSLAAGNGLSRFDTETGEITDHVKINEGINEPLDLQLDPATGLIYALWREQPGDAPPTLSIIDSQKLTPTQAITGVSSITAAEGLLFTVDDNQLTRYETTGGTLIETERRELTPAVTGPLAVDPANDRLYLARSSEGVWRLDSFEAGTLEPVASYPAEGSILNIFPTPASDELLLIVNVDEFMTLYRLTIDGELADFPHEIGPRYGATGMAVSPDAKLLYFSTGQPAPANLSASNPDGPALAGLTVDTLLPLDEIPLLTPFDDLVIDAGADQAFALYPFDDLLYQIDLGAETYEISKTAVELKDVLLDSETNRIFVSDTANRVRVLEAETLEAVAETTLTGNSADYGFERGFGSGHLSLDADRERLYVSGYPATVLDSSQLIELDTIEPGGQIALNPPADAIYASNCGVTIIEADTLNSGEPLPGTGHRPEPPATVPDPCVITSRFDVENQLLYSIVSNRLPGSNAGTYLDVYDVAIEPTLVFTDLEVSLRAVEPDEANRRAFVTHSRESHRRLRTLDMTATPAPAYATQLLGVYGDVRYSPLTDRLYLSDFDQPRLLTLDAGTLDILGETRLPANHSYRLVELDPATDRLYLTGLDGQLLVVSTADSVGAEQTDEPQESRLPDGSVSAAAFSGDTTVARIETSLSEFSYSARLYLSRDDGQSWADLSRNLPDLPVSAMAISPGFESDQTLFAGLLAPGQTGGLYKSTDGGQSWQAAMNGLRDLWVEALYISPNFSRDQLIFARTTYAGLHQSLDGGQNWTALADLDPNLPFPTASSDNSVAFSDNGVILISQSLPDVVDGLFLSTVQSEGALSPWLRVLDVPAELLALGPQGEVALAFANGLWRSADGGLSWEAVGAGLTGIDNLIPTAILFSPTFTQDQTIYFFFRDTSSAMRSMLFRSTNAGQTWQPWQRPFTDRNVTSVTFAPDGDFIFGEDNGDLTRLAPDALVWTTPQSASDTFPIDDLAASPGYETDQTLFVVSSQQGLYKTTDGGQSWEHTAFPARSSGYGLTKYRLAVSPTFAEDETLYMATGRSLHRSTDGGATWEQVALNTGPAGQNLTFPAQQVAFSPNFARDETLLAATSETVYRSADGGQRWDEILSQLDSGSITDLLAVGPDGETIYARFGYSQSLFVSADGGRNWQAQTTPDEYFSVVSSTVGPNGTLSIVPEFDARLLQSDAKAEGWRSVAIPSDLTSVTAVTTTPDGTLFAAGQGGVFYSEDNGQSWQPVAGDGLPPDSEISNLAATPTHRFAATLDGRVFVSADGGESWQDSSVVK